jgi:hypothetical protein
MQSAETVMERVEAFDSYLRLHRPLMSTKNQRLTHFQFIYNSTVLSTQLSTGCGSMQYPEEGLHNSLADTVSAQTVVVNKDLTPYGAQGAVNDVWLRSSNNLPSIKPSISVDWGFETPNVVRVTLIL